MKLNIYIGIFFLLGVVVDSQTKKKWLPVPVNSKTAIHAASLAAEYLHVQYIRLIKAWENVEVQHKYVENRVLFKARCQSGLLKLCQADVTLSGLAIVANAYCWQPSGESEQAY